MFRIARRVAKDRVISTVDPEARHGHKTAARGFDGYKGHIAIDPDSEIITATTVTAGNVADGSVGDVLVADVLVEPAAQLPANQAPDAGSADEFVAEVVELTSATEGSDIGEIKMAARLPANQAPAAEADGGGADELVAEALVEAPAADALDGGGDEFVAEVVEPTSATEESDIGEIKMAAQLPANQAPVAEADGGGGAADELVADVLAETPATESLDDRVAETGAAAVAGGRVAEAAALVEIYGDSSYGTAQFVETIEGAGAEANVKVQPPSAPEGKFAKDAFDIDLTSNTVRCPAGMLVVIRSSTAGSDGLRLASFGVRCNNCELRSQCTDGKAGRTIRVHPHEATLQRSRNRQRDPAWKARYRATRPKVERKIGHLMQRRHGGRRARVRGCARITHDFALLGAAHNLRRLATLGVHYDGSTWTR